MLSNNFLFKLLTIYTLKFYQMKLLVTLKFLRLILFNIFTVLMVILQLHLSRRMMNGFILHMMELCLLNISFIKFKQLVTFQSQKKLPMTKSTLSQFPSPSSKTPVYSRKQAENGAFRMLQHNLGHIKNNHPIISRLEGVFTSYHGRRWIHGRN